TELPHDTSGPAQREPNQRSSDSSTYWSMRSRKPSAGKECLQLRPLIREAPGALADLGAVAAVVGQQPGVGRVRLSERNPGSLFSPMNHRWTVIKNLPTGVRNLTY